MLDADLRAGAAPGVAGFGPLTFAMTAGSGGGPGNVVATGTGSFTVTLTTGERYPTYLEFVFLTGRMTEAELFFEGAGAPFPADVRTRLVSAVAQRLAAL